MHGNWFQLEQLTFLIASSKCISSCTRVATLAALDLWMCVRVELLVYVCICICVRATIKAPRK